MEIEVKQRDRHKVIRQKHLQKCTGQWRQSSTAQPWPKLREMKTCFTTATGREFAAWFPMGLHSYGIYSYGLHSYGLCSYDTMAIGREFADWFSIGLLRGRI